MQSLNIESYLKDYSDMEDGYISRPAPMKRARRPLSRIKSAEFKAEKKEDNFRKQSYRKYNS